MKALRKITIKDVCGRISVATLVLADKAGTPKVPLMKVTGVALRSTVGVTDKGEFIKFFGDFLAINYETGETMSSGTCILPGFIAEQLHARLQTEGVSNVAFGFDISAHYDETALTKYVYDIESLLQAEQPSPAQLLMQQVLSRPAALEAHSRLIPSAGSGPVPQAPSQPAPSAGSGQAPQAPSQPAPQAPSQPAPSAGSGQAPSQPSPQAASTGSGQARVARSRA